MSFLCAETMRQKFIYAKTIRDYDGRTYIGKNKQQESQNGARRQSEQRKNDAVQPYDGQQPICRQLAGVTVEKKEGSVKQAEELGCSITLVDLPGIYSLSPYSMEEIVARDYVTKEKPDVVINIVDATNIERNLYLSIQLIEMERPVVIALNMMDEVYARGDSINAPMLSKLLNVSASFPSQRRPEKEPRS